MSSSRQRLRRTSRIALLVALGSGLTQGAAVIAGYVTGLEGRLLAVFTLVSATSLIALTPEVLQPGKKIRYYPNIWSKRNMFSYPNN